MALPKYKTSRANTRSRRAQWKAKPVQVVTVTSPSGEQITVPQNQAAAARRGYIQ